MSDPYRFVVTGKALRQAIRQLRPAFPRKREAPLWTVVISAVPGKATFSVVGAAISIPAETSGGFTAEIPFTEFKMIASDPYRDGERLTFEFARGALTFRGLTTKSSKIHVVADSIEPKGTLPGAGSPIVVDPAGTPMGLPLLGAYVHIRKYGFQPTVDSRALAEQQAQVQAILAKADKLLAPLGLTRADLETILDKRLGLENLDAS
jgi:hypothetical protein